MLQRIRFALAYFGKPRWDTGISPPELIEFMASHPPRRALDLGCGSGTNVVTLAKAGWQVTGVDFVPRAILAARRKVRQAGAQADLRVGDVTRLDDIHGPFDLVFDLGCFHSLPPASRPAYLANLERLLAPEGTYLLYGFLPDANTPNQPGIKEAEISAFEDRLRLVKRVNSTDRGGTRPSAWFTWTPKYGRAFD
jgi:cyclopropane fatty-acyl-phospholipid synthase-like methyltransferase